MEPFRTPSGYSLPSRVFSAPMAGYTDPPYRLLLKEMGAPVLMTEMIDSHALNHLNDKTLKMLGRRDPDLHTQIAAGTPILAERATEVLLSQNTAGLNLNMGCPAKKVVSCGGGSNLLRAPNLIRDICRIVRQRTRGLPFSVKFRSGWNSDTLNFEEVGKIFEGEGVDFVMLHARTRAQSFSGFADWSHIRRLKEILSIPVIGNGDVVSYESALRLVQETGCDGVAIGRGAVGNPWLYHQADRAIRGLSPLSDPTPDQRLRTILRHYQLALEYYGPHLAPHIIRKHLVGYMKGLPGQKAIKEQIFLSECLSPDQLHNILGDYFYRLESWLGPMTSAQSA